MEYARRVDSIGSSFRSRKGELPQNWFRRDKKQEEPQVFAEQEDPAREQSRSMVMAQYGIVAMSQTLASRAGAAVLAKGGSEMAAMLAS